MFLRGDSVIIVLKNPLASAEKWTWVGLKLHELCSSVEPYSQYHFACQLNNTLQRQGMPGTTIFIVISKIITNYKAWPWYWVMMQKKKKTLINFSYHVMHQFDNKYTTYFIIGLLSKWLLVFITDIFMQVLWLL